MKGTCYWCNNAIPDGKVKRCARCRLTTYCSKECQTASWKAGHKGNCTPNPLFNNPDGTPMPKTEKYSDEWVQQQVDKQLSAWIQAWRKVFCHFAIISLDLPNHSADRNVTHCMTLWIQANMGHETKIQDYWIKKAEVNALADLQEKFPGLKGLFPEGPVDPTKIRFVLILTNAEDEMLRARCLQFNHLDLDKFRQMPKDVYASQPVKWDEVIMYMVEEMSPEDALPGI